MSDELLECLPVELRGADTQLTRLAGGLSGAAVYRVDVAGRAYVLKLSREPLEAWRRRTTVLRAAAEAGVAPRVVHVDESQRAVLSELIAQRALLASGANSAALTALGAALRRVHALPLPTGLASKEPRALLSETWTTLAAFPVPAWVAEAVQRVLNEQAPPAERRLVLSHNDVNPSNILFDGRRVLFLDWDSAGANDPLYDLATLAVFLRLDETASAVLLAAHDEAPVGPLPVRFTYLRRLISALCGVLFLQVARAGGHAGGASALAPPLASGFNARTPDGQWQYGLALLNASRH